MLQATCLKTTDPLFDLKCKSDQFEKSTNEKIEMDPMMISIQKRIEDATKFDE